MFFLFFLLLVGTFLFLQRGRLGPPPWLSARHSPEGEAKKILAERFARGDIGSDEFMERASILNWTPGSEGIDQWQPGGRKGRKGSGRR